MNIHWENWCWSWNSNTLATRLEELTIWKRPWSWERLKMGGEGDNRGWASPTQWTWVWVGSRSWWWTRKPGVLQSTGLQRVRHDWATELNWQKHCWKMKRHTRRHVHTHTHTHILSQYQSINIYPVSTELSCPWLLLIIKGHQWHCTSCLYMEENLSTLSFKLSFPMILLRKNFSTQVA